MTRYMISSYDKERPPNSQTSNALSFMDYVHVDSLVRNVAYSWN